MAYHDDLLDVTFEKGDYFLVAVESVLPRVNAAPFGFPDSRVSSSAAIVAPPDWPKLRIGETGDVLEVPAGDAAVEIPWDRIRSLADPEFRAHLADQAAQRTRRIGKRIRAMRLEAGLSPAALAEKVGIHEVHYAMVTVLAMGIGLFAPPFGVGFYAAGAIGRIDPNLGIRPIMAYLLAMLVGLVVVAAVPWVSIGFL